ncbi:hypothetical protein PX554_26175 [Sphingomonas sp. H39-1-10]|uniref:hypothetical protein n=1 Tax=Sphingomonas pollutisoli TaxID=3030829 RepID=UPI0023B8D94B|nr:hypothetical protein [Sphingomonas pollutisoli]MDF0491606.1 hypothetical protein [Sphingomonas pollutisoli]
MLDLRIINAATRCAKGSEISYPCKAPRVVQDHTNMAAASAAIVARIGGAA